MQHGIVLKKFNINLLTPPPKCTQWVRHRPWIRNRISYVSYLLYLCLHAEIIANLNFTTFDPTYGVRGWGKTLITVMLIYRLMEIIAYSEKLSDIIILEKCEVYSTKIKANIAFALA